MQNKFLPNKKISSFHPPQRTLMGPGPSEINPRVLAAMSVPAIGYLDPVFVEMMEELKSLLRYTFQTNNMLTFPVSGPGSVGMEMCFVNLVEPGDKVIVGRNGVFGGRMIENVERTGGKPVIVDDEWGAPVDPRCPEKKSRRKNRRVRPRGNVHRLRIRCKNDFRNRAQTRLLSDHGCGDIARGNAGAHRRMGYRRGVFRQSKMSVVHAGLGARQL
jgi:hypothetical protein